MTKQEITAFAKADATDAPAPLPALTLSKDQAIDLSLKLWHVTSIVEIGASWYAYRGEGKVDRGYLSPTCFKVLCRDRAGVWRTL